MWQAGSGVSLHRRIRNEHFAESVAGGYFPSRSWIGWVGAVEWLQFNFVCRGSVRIPPWTQMPLADFMLATKAEGYYWAGDEMDIILGSRFSDTDG